MSRTIGGPESTTGAAPGGWVSNARARPVPLFFAFLLLTVAIALLPLLARGPSCGQDFDFHLESWLDAARSWHQGLIYPRWDASANFAAGEPRFVFYPPLSWMLGAALGSILPWTWVPLAYTAIVLLGAGWSFRAMAREWMPEDTAAIAACLYLVNPYMLFVIYERSAMGELLAAVWLPLLVLYGLRERRRWLPLVAAVAGIWLSDAPAGILGSYMLAGLVAVAAIQERAWRLVLRAAAGFALGLGLAGFWLLPAIYQQQWVQIEQAIGPLMRIEDSFLFGYLPLAGLSSEARFDVVYHNQVLRTASWITAALMAGAAVAVWQACRRRRSRLWLPLVIVGVAVCLLQLRWSDLIWRIAPELKYLQFPWRWMLVLGMIAAALAGLAIHTRHPSRKALALAMVLIMATAASMALLSSAVFWQPCDGEDNVQAQVAAFRSRGFEGTDEYTLQGADESDLEEIVTKNSGPGGPVAVVTSPREDGDPIPARVRILRWQTQRRSAVVIPQRPGFAVLWLTDYPAWRVTKNGAPIHPLARSDGRMMIPVEAGENRIEIRWALSWDQVTGMGISLLALAVTLALSWMERRQVQRKMVPVP